MKKVGKILSGVWLILVIAALILFGLPRLFQVGIYNVTSGSMTPTYQIGDLVYAFPVDNQDIKVGDSISFVLNEQGTVATHRVIEVDHENKKYHTKGDANEVADGTPVLYENIIGVVRFSLPKAGMILETITTGSGRFVLIGIFLLYLVWLLISSIMTKKVVKGGGDETQAHSEKMD